MESLHELFGDGDRPVSKKKHREGPTGKKWLQRRRTSKELMATSRMKIRQCSPAPNSNSCSGLGNLAANEASQRIYEAGYRNDTTSGTMETTNTSLPPEPALGNIEYKLKLVNPTRQRFEHLVTQMKWRLREGEGEAIYEIGVEDNGFMAGLSASDLQASLETLCLMAGQLGATVNVLRRREIPVIANVNANAPCSVRHAAEVLVRKIPDDRTSIDLRIAVLGNADVGKSTLLGVLTQGQLDNGRGRARLIMFRHLHEVQTGRTSSISHEIMGFDPQGQVVNYDRCQTAEEIMETSAKLITFIDLAGHYKYLHTTIFGLTGYSPHYIMLVVSANTGVAGTTLDHLNLALALGVPFFIVVTKIDVTAKPVLARTLEQLALVLSMNAKRKPLVIVDGDTAMSSAARSIRAESGGIVPIFLASSVTGKGLDFLKEFLHVLPPYLSNVERERLEKEPVNFQIDEIWDIPEVGAVVGGLLTKGVITENILLKLGPVSGRGEFVPVTVKTIHRNKANSRVVRASQSASLSLVPHSLDDSPNSRLPRLRRGMVLLHPHQPTCAARYFLAKIKFLAHEGAGEDDVILVHKNSHATVHIGNVRQSATLRGFFGTPYNTNPVVLNYQSTGATDEITVMFELLRGPEYLEANSKVLVRHGRVKGQGRVTHIFYGDGLHSSASSGSSGDEGPMHGEEYEE